MKIRLTALFLTIAALSVSITGCGLMIEKDASETFSPATKESVTADTEADSQAPETAAPFTRYTDATDYDAQIESYLSALPAQTYDGAAFFITTPSAAYLEPEAVDSIMSRVLYERNRSLEDRYNVLLMHTVTTSDTMLAELKNAIASDSYYTDLMMVPLYLLGTFQGADVLENLRSVPYLNLYKSYFYADSVNACSANYGTWAIAGPASVTPGDFSCVYVNTDLLQELSQPAPYSLVDSGKWTWDAFYQYVAALQTENAAAETSYYTVTTQNAASRLADLVFASYGKTYIRSGARRTPAIAFTPDTAADPVASAHRIYADQYAITDAAAGAASCFADGKSLFLIDYVYVTGWLTNAHANWGVVPLPKGSEAGTYHTLAANTSLLFCIPKGSGTGEMSAVLLSALNAASKDVLYNAYVEQSMYHTLRDNASIAMLDRILDTICFDFAFAFGTNYPTVAKGSYTLVRDAAQSGSFSAYAQSLCDAADATMRQYLASNR